MVRRVVTDRERPALRYLKRATPWLIGAALLFVVGRELIHGRGLPVGNDAPPLSAALDDGTRFDLAGRRGSIVLVNFWATWCPPCRQEAPVLSRAHERLRRSGGTVVGLSMDAAPLPGVVRVARRLGMHYPIALAPPGSAESFQVDVLPTSYLVDAEGKIRWSYVGGLTDRELGSALDRLTAVD
jgi:thiol-disulfide isomerase/thioredoxin